MQISVQTGGILTKIGEERCYEAIAKSGITAIDWNIDRDLPSQTVKDLNYLGISVFERSFEEVLAHHEAELAIIRKNGLTITQAHTPFPAYLPGHPELLDFMIGVYKNCIRLCDYAGCKNLIDQMEASGAADGETEGVATPSRNIEGVSVGITLREKAPGDYKISVRTDDTVDASELCRMLGGGGHARASGCRLSGTAEEVVNRMIAAASVFLEETV
jgi:hypothetical protein